MLAIADSKAQQTIISPKLIRAYDYAISEIETSHGEASEALSKYWWALYVIKRDNLWRAKYDDGKFKLWLSDISKETYGPSKTDFYDTMGAIERLKKMGKTEDEIRPLLGKMTTALKYDMKLLFSRNGKGALLPEVLKQMDDDGVTPSQFVDSLPAMSSSDQRQEVLGLVIKEHIFFTDGIFDENTGRVMANVIWENNEQGIVIKGTITMTFVETTEPRQSKTGTYLPENIAHMLISKLDIVE